MGRGKWVIVLAVVVVLAAVAAAYAAGQAKTDAPKVVRAQRFEVVDGEGKVLATLGVEAEGSPALRLHGKKGKGGIILAVLPNGNPMQALFDDKDKMRVEVLVFSGDSSPRLALNDENAKTIWEAP